MNTSVLTVGQCELLPIENLLQNFNLKLEVISNDKLIPGSYWGDSEAGLILNTIYVRKDTPIHSLLHETCHYICMDSHRREKVDTNAEGDYDEENGVCYLQILLSDSIPEMGINRMLMDMDTWGYTFRLGSAKSWFIEDSEDTTVWLKGYNLINEQNKPTFKVRNT